jgi:hypothetical protein
MVLLQRIKSVDPGNLTSTIHYGVPERLFQISVGTVALSFEISHALCDATVTSVTSWLRVSLKRAH